MKLYNLLFEEEEQLQLFPDEPKHHGHYPSSVPSRFISPFYSLVQTGSSQRYALIDKQAYLSDLSNAKGDFKLMVLSYKNWLAATISTRGFDGELCDAAKQIATSAANPKYPGAGYAAYCLMSKLHPGEPFTSDRESSTSNSAKKLWARIENSGEWTRIPLDNFSVNDDYDNDKTYWKIKGTWPNRKVIPLSKPNTESEEDDCIVPGTDSAIINRRLGSADAWIYKGSLNPQSLISNGERMLTEGNHIIDNSSQRRIISKATNRLFDNRYNGISS